MELVEGGDPRLEACLCIAWSILNAATSLLSFPSLSAKVVSIGISQKPQPVKLECRTSK